jgi:biotin carboxylase
LDELFAAAQIVGFPAVVKPEFGASAMGCVRVDDLESLPGIYTLVRSVVDPDANNFLRAGNDLLLEEYMDGVEFDVDLVMKDGKCLFSSVSQNWPTAEPSFQETGLHCPPDHDRKAVAKLVDLCIETAVGFGLLQGVLHIEGKCTSRGPRVVEVNTRLGGGRIWEIVNAVWGVDLVEVQLRSCLGLDLNVKPARKPLAGVWNTIVHAPRSGVLHELPIDAAPPRGCRALYVDGVAEIGTPVDGPEEIFSTVLADITLMADDVRTARALTAEVLHGPILVT